MTDIFKMMLAQLNPVVGDIAGNVARAKQAWESAKAAGADMVALTEMFVTGYQTQDLILKPAFVSDAIAAVEGLAAQCADGPALGIGGPVRQGSKLYNGYYVLEGGRIHARVLKHHLPNDAVFDEKRVFASADVHGPYVVKGVRIGTPICEDAWHPDVAETLAGTLDQVATADPVSPGRLRPGGAREGQRIYDGQVRIGGKHAHDPYALVHQRIGLVSVLLRYSHGHRRYLASDQLDQLELRSPAVGGEINQPVESPVPRMHQGREQGDPLQRPGVFAVKQILDQDGAAGALAARHVVDGDEDRVEDEQLGDARGRVRREPLPWRSLKFSRPRPVRWTSHPPANRSAWWMWPTPTSTAFHASRKPSPTRRPPS